MSYLIPCQNCGKELPDTFMWYVCDKCGFRVCTFCLNKHSSKYGSGFKCSRCAFGKMQLIRS